MADNLLQEVDAALRADRAAAFWNKHRGTLVGVVIAIILGTAANSVWQQMREAKGAKLLTALTENQRLLEQKDYAKAASGFQQVAAQASGEVKALALIWQSRALVAEGKKAEAAEALSQAAGMNAGLWSDIACLRLAGVDEAKASCLAAKGNSPLMATRAQWAVAQAWAKGDHKDAHARIEAMLADKNLSPEARDRLTQWLAILQAGEHS